MIREIENKTEWTNDYKVKLFWDLVAEVKRLRKGIEQAVRWSDANATRELLKEMIEW
tara:strand:- start:188 stop:358 length:171 start_codon:yes stop_codon:yes gene_type:complete